MTYDDFRAALKTGGISNLYLFTGEETYLQEFCLSSAKKALIDPAFADFNFKQYIEAPPFEDAASFINSVPLMSPKKLVIFNNCALFKNKLADKKRWAELFLSLPSYAVVIIRETEESKGAATDVKKAVMKAAAHVEFKYLPEARLRPWLIKAAASRGKSLSAANASYIIASVGRSMTVLHAEAEKITAKAEEFEITKKDIDSVIIKPLTETVFKLIDAIFTSRPDLCYKIILNLRRQNQEPGAIISVIASQILVIYKAKLMMEKDTGIAEVKKALGGSFKADKAVGNASKKTGLHIEHMIHTLKKAELDTKTGQMDPWCALDLIIAES